MKLLSQLREPPLHLGHRAFRGVMDMGRVPLSDDGYPHIGGTEYRDLLRDAMFSAEGYLGPKPLREYDRVDAGLMAVGVLALVLLKREDMARPLIEGFSSEQIFRATRAPDFEFHDPFVMPKPKPRWWQIWKR